MTPPRPRRHALSARVMVGTLVAVQVLVGSTMVASADGPSASTTALTQNVDTVAYGSEGADIFSVTVTGQGDAPTGSVAVADSNSGTTICTAALEAQAGDSSTATCSPSDSEIASGTDFTTVVATYGGDSANAPSASSPDQSFTVTPTLPPAPAGFAASVATIYQSEYSTAQGIGPTEDLLSVSQFQQEVSGLSAADLAALYYATQQYPEWTQIPALMQTIAAGVPTQAGLSADTVPAQKPSGGTGSSTVHAVLDAAVFPTPSAAGGPTSATLVGVGPYSAPTCPSGPSDAAVFAAEIVLDVVSGVYNVVSVTANIVGTLISVAAQTAAQLVHDILAYEQLPEQECQANDVTGYLANIDNTTVVTYGLVTQLGTTVGQLQATDSTTLQDVQNIQTELTTLQQTFEQTLLSDTQTLQATLAGDTQSTASELQTIQSAMAQDVTTIQASQTTIGQQVTADADKDSSALQSSLSAALSQILHETDTDAQGLTTLVTQGDQQIMNTLNSDFSTAQQQYQENLKIQIEQAMAGWGPVVPEVQFTLPASSGGFLNATPVGVQEVVTSDIATLQALGVKIKPAAITDLASANAALAGGQYLTAFADFAQSYQAFA